MKQSVRESTGLEVRAMLNFDPLTSDDLHEWQCEDLAFLVLQLL